MAHRDDDASPTIVDRSPADDFAAEPSRRRRRTARALVVGELLGGRYRIERSLAEGGMGEVYDAFDLELEEHVALKTILPELADDRRHIERFKREVQLARRITHPSVCRLFELGRAEVSGEEVWFITMELLAGETLSARLARGRLTTAEALPIVRQLAGGLEATHRSGIVHRDLKPENIVLCRDGRAVLMDFGVARTASSEQLLARGNVTLAGELVGSPMYMAPEQLDGKQVTPRSDIYALGVVIYEMVTGELPFDGANDYATATKRLKFPPVPPRKRVPELDPRWEAAILRCLERPPELRFANAPDMLDAIRPRASGWRIPAALALVVAVAASVVLVMRHPRGEGFAADSLAEGGERPSIAVIPTGEGDALVLASAVAEALERELSASERLRVIAGERAQRIARTVTDQRAIGDALGARLVAQCSVSQSADRLIVTLRVSRGAASIELDAAGASADFPAVVDQLADQLYRRLSLPAITAAEHRAAHAAIVQPLDAARSYALGQIAIGRDDMLAARDALVHAAELAPDRALVHLALARTWHALGYDQRAVAEVDRAFAQSHDLARTDRFVVEATRATIENDPAHAAQVYGALWTFFPDDIEWGFALADAQSSAGRNKELATTLAAMRAAPLPSRNDPRIDVVEADLAENLGDFARERSAAERAIASAKGPGDRVVNIRAASYLGWALLQLGDPDAAVRAYDAGLAVARELHQDIDVASAESNIASVRRRQGKLEEATKLYGDALAIYRALGAKGRMWVALNGTAIALSDSGNTQGARDMFTQARDTCHDTGDEVCEATALANLGLVEESGGALADARAAEEAAGEIARRLGDRRIAAIVSNELGSIFHDLGDSEEAHRQYEQALAADEASGDTAAAATTRSALAQVTIDDGKAADAIAPARAAAEELAHEGLHDEAAAAYAVLAQATLAAGHVAEAQAAGDTAYEHAQQGAGKPTALEVELVRTRVAAAAGHGNASRADAVHDQAKALGLVELSLEAALAAAQIRGVSADQYRAIAQQARTAGFEQLARRAEHAR